MVPQEVGSHRGLNFLVGALIDLGVKAPSGTDVYNFLKQVTTENVVILSDQPNRGRTVIEKLERHGAVAKFAVVLTTPDDEMANGARRARPNVILELGFFIGSIGRENVCVIRQSPIDDPSDIAGIVYTSVDAGGDWKGELIRELRAAGIEVDDA